jgi:hypothetical protein
MTNPHPDDIQQAFFGWSLDTGQLTMLTSSFQHENDVARWSHLLGEHIRMVPVDGGTLPSWALSRIDFGDVTAVVRRVGQGFNSGRNNSHALIGPTGALTTLSAMGLTYWDGWRETADHSALTQPVHVQEIANYADKAEHLRRPAERLEHEIGIVLARLLDHPHAPISILGCPDDDRLALVWGLYTAADEYLRMQFQVQRRWSFSTYATRHNVALKALPELVFLPKKEDGAVVVERTIVDISRPETISNERRYTVDQLLKNAFLGTTLPGRQTSQSSSVPGQSAQRSTSRPPGSGKSISQPALTVAMPRPSPPDVAQLAQNVANASTPNSFERELAQLQAVTVPAEARRTVRGVLVPTVLAKTAARLPDDTRRDLLERLLKAVYGHDFDDFGDPDAVNHVVEVLRTARTNGLTSVLTEAGHRLGNKRIVAAAKARANTLAANRRSLPEAVQRRRQLVGTAVALAALTMAFVFGIFVGNSDEANAPSPNPNQNATKSAASSSSVPLVTPAPRGPATFRVRYAPKAGEKTWVVPFLEINKSYVPQFPCQQSGEIWTCLTNVAQDANPVPGLVAFAVPVDQLPDLTTKAASNTPSPTDPKWGRPLSFTP